MRHPSASIAALALAASVAAMSPSSAIAHPSPWWDTTIQCSEPGGPCVGSSATSYNSCVDLALARGYNLGKGDRRGLDLFVYQCLAGRVPR
jgi:hypothetical protein